MIYTLILVAAALTAAALIPTVLGIHRNYNAIKHLGLPLVVLPISLENPIWMILAKHVTPWLKYIPFGNGNFSKFGHAGWEWEQKCRVHEDLGDAIVLVTPGTNWIYLCNAETNHDIIQRERRHEFKRPVELSAMLDVFGPNISSAQGEDWQRQRKVTVTAFSEKANKVVWTESLSQARQMLQYWIGQSGGVRTTAKDARTLALDVLMSAGFGKSFPFKPSSETSPTGPLSYRDALAIILNNALLTLALGPDFVARITYPAKLARIGEAIRTFRSYMTEDFEREKKAFQAKENTQENLMTNLVRASLADDAELDGGDGKRRTGLSQLEVFGNIFVFNFAGHDTTAHSLTFTFYLLAAHPEVQDWMREEICHVFGENSDMATWSYDSFPRLNRCLAVLHETLRLYNPLLDVIKRTTAATTPTELTIAGRTYAVPPRTRIGLNLNAVHTHPRYWGPDGLDFRPARWVLQQSPDPTPGGTASSSIDRESLLTPPRGAFMAWSDGNRACPGRKFAQVEHVAVMAALFGGWRVEPAPVEGEEGDEGEERARKRVLDALGDSGMRLLFQMLRPEKVALRWRRR